MKSEDQQALLSLHRVRAQWLATRTARIITMRALLLEFGIIAPRGAQRFMNELHEKLAASDRKLPPYVQRMVEALWSKVRDLEEHRMLFIHGARAALNGARRLESRDQPLSQLQQWALRRAQTSHANQAAVALANKLVRIAWAVWYHERDFDGDHVIRVAA